MMMVIKKTKATNIGFIKYIIKVLRKMVIANINLKKLEPWEEYFKSMGVEKSPKEIIVSGLKNLYFKEFGDRFLVYIGEGKSLIGDYTLGGLCKLLDQGALDKKPLRLFSEPMKNIEKNIGKYFDLYCFMPM